jgi:hypothetical protein
MSDMAIYRQSWITELLTHRSYPRMRKSITGGRIMFSRTGNSRLLSVAQPQLGRTQPGRDDLNRIFQRGDTHSIPHESAIHPNTRL